MEVHVLKCQSKYFDAVWSHIKTFEIRNNDQGFEVDDILILREYCVEKDTFSGRIVVAEVRYILGGSDGPTEWLPDGFVCMSIDVLHLISNTAI